MLATRTAARRCPTESSDVPASWHCAQRSGRLFEREPARFQQCCQTRNPAATIQHAAPPPAKAPTRQRSGIARSAHPLPRCATINFLNRDQRVRGVVTCDRKLISTFILEIFKRASRRCLFKISGYYSITSCKEYWKNPSGCMKIGCDIMKSLAAPLVPST